MASFTMKSQTFVTPTGTVDSPLDLSLTAASGTTIHAVWTATGLVSFTGHFRNKSNNSLFGPQSFVNNSGGNWIWSQAGTPFDNTTPIGFEMDTITNNGHNITVTFSVDNGFSYSGHWIRRSGIWVWEARFIRRSGAWVFAPRYIRRSGAWVLVHR